MNRETLTEELRRLQGSYTELTRAQRKRVQQICFMLWQCLCRNCGKQYNEQKARGDYKGFCSAKCQHAKAKALGFCNVSKLSQRDRLRFPTEFDVLKHAGEVGSVFVLK